MATLAKGVAHAAAAVVNAQRGAAVEGTATALLQANAPHYFWLYAACHWAKNDALTHENQHGVTPYESLRGRPPPPLVARA